MNQFTGNGETDGFIGAVPASDAVTDLGSSSKRWRDGSFVNVITTGSVTAGSVDVQSGLISNVGDPVSAQDVATKNYVDVADQVRDGLLTTHILTKGVANGFASLDSDGTVPLTQIRLNDVKYCGAWDSSTNSPPLVSGTGEKGCYYVVTVAGATTLDGISVWDITDWVIFNGTVWQKVDNTDQVVSVSGRQGAVTLSTADLLGAFVPPKLTTSQRDALTPVEGEIIYNTDTRNIETYDENVNWRTHLTQTNYDAIVTPHDLSYNTSNDTWTVSRSSQTGHFDAFKCFDGEFISGRHWESAVGNFSGGFATNQESFEGYDGPWIKVSMDVVKTITRYRLAHLQTYIRPIQWRIFTSLDDTNWTIATTQSTDYTSNNGNLAYTDYIDMPTTLAKYIVFQVTKTNWSDSRCFILELDYDGVPHSTVDITNARVGVANNNLRCDIDNISYHIAGGNKVSKTFDFQGGGNNTLYVGDDITIRWPNTLTQPQYLVTGSQTASYSFTISYNHNTTGTADFKYGSGTSAFNGWRYFSINGGTRNTELSRASSGGRYDFTLRHTTDNTKPSLIGTIFHGDPTGWATVKVEQIYP